MSTTGQIRLLGWTSSGEILVAIANGIMRPEPAEVDVVAVSPNGSSRKLFSLASVYPATLTLSDDRSVVAFTSRNQERDDIWTASVRPNAMPKKVTSNAVTRQFLTNLTFSPDAKTIFFDKQEEVNGISMFENFN
jgi:hypothetical protein